MIFRPQLPLAFHAIWRQNNAILHLIGEKTAVAFVILILQYLGHTSGFVIMHVNTNFAITPEFLACKPEREFTRKV